MSKKNRFTIYSLQVTVLILLSSLLISGCGRNTPERLLNDAREAAQQNDFTTAIIKLETFLDKYPNDPQAIMAQYQLGRLHLMQGQFDLALKEYDKFLKKYPPSSEYYTFAKFDMVNCYMGQKKVDKAKELLQKLSDDTSKPGVALSAKFALAGFYMEQKQPDKAQDVWQKLSADTAQPFAAFRAKFYLAESNEQQNNWVKAEKWYRDVLASYPLPKKLIPRSYTQQNEIKDNVDATLQLAMVLAKEGKTQKAIETYQSLQNKFPQDEYAQGVAIWTRVTIGDIYAQQKQTKKAQESYDQALVIYSKITTDKLVPEKAAWATTKIAEIYYVHLSDTTKAVEIYNEFKKNYPKSRYTPVVQQALMSLTKPPVSKDSTKQSAPPTGSRNTTNLLGPAFQKYDNDKKKMVPTD